jgi:hypothetical protein
MMMLVFMQINMVLYVYIIRAKRNALFGEKALDNASFHM